jgi:hypothetical protein
VTRAEGCATDLPGKDFDVIGRVFGRPVNELFAELCETPLAARGVHKLPRSTDG